MIRKFKNSFILFGLIFVLLFPNLVLAEKPGIADKLSSFGRGSGYAEATETSMAEIAGSVVAVFLGLLGIIFIILIIYAGYNWMTAGGNEEKVKKAQDTLKRAIIGLIIIVSAYAIWKFIFEWLVNS